MRPTYLRDITEEEKNKLYAMIDDDSNKSAGYRAKIILLRNEGYTVPEIRRKTNHHHDNNIRKWVHRFNGHVIDGIVSSRRHGHDALNITDDIENEIVRIASANPRELGLKFSTWSLRVLAGYVMEKKIVGSMILHTIYKQDSWICIIITIIIAIAIIVIIINCFVTN